MNLIQNYWQRYRLKYKVTKEITIEVTNAEEHDNSDSGIWSNSETIFEVFFLYRNHAGAFIQNPRFQPTSLDSSGTRQTTLP